MKKKLVMLLVAVVAIVSLVIVGCAPEAAPPPPEEGAPPPEEEEEAPPAAPEAEKVEWRMVSTWTPHYAPVEGDKFWCDQIRQMSNGRFDISHFPAGSLMSAFETFDAVSTGTVEAGGEFAGYWVGKDVAFDLWASVACYFTKPDMMNWYFEGGGKELVDELYGKYNMVYFPLTMLPIEEGIQSHIPITTLKDVKGLKIRAGTLLLMDVLKEAGAEVVSLPGGDVYEAAQKGVIDAFEVGSLGNNWPMGLHEVSEYIVAPAWWQPATPCGVVINKDAWDKLPDDLKAIAENAAYSSWNVKTAWLDYLEIDGLKNNIDYGMTITHWTPAALDEIQEIVLKSMEARAAENPDYARILKSQVDFLKAYAPARDFAEPYTWGFNAIEYPEIK